MKRVHPLWKFCKYIILRFQQDGCTTRAAALAFATLLSLIPLFTVSFSVFTLFPIFQDFALKIQYFIIQNFVATSAEIIQQHLETLLLQTSKLSGIGMLLLVLTAVLMIFNMEQAFNAIWRVEKRRSFLSAFLMYWAVLTLAPILIGVGIIITTYLISLPFISTAADILGLKKLLFVTTPYFSTLFAFTLVYFAVPNCKVKLRDALIGGITATILFELAKQAFVVYITRFSTYHLLYGALATIPIFLVWIYLCWLITLFGAVVSATLKEYHRFLKVSP